MRPAIGFTLVDNLVAQPEFRAPGDYRLKPGSACSACSPATLTGWRVPPR